MRGDAKGTLAVSMGAACADRKQRPRSIVFVLLLFVLPALLAFAAPVQAATTHKLTGTFNAGGTLTEPSRVAVDNSNGSVYVLTGGSGGASTIRKFDSSGNPANFSFLGSSSLAANCGFFGACVQGIAVDNSTGTNRGMIYLATNSSAVLVYRPTGQFVVAFSWSHVQRDNPGGGEGPACGVAVDSSGALYVQHSSGFFEDGSYTDKFRPGTWRINPNPPQLWPIAGIFEQPEARGICKLNSDANGFLYTGTGEFGGTGTLRRWPMSVVNLPSPPSKVIDTGVTSFYADQATNDLYSDEETQIARFDDSGEPVEIFGDGELTESTGVAVRSGSGTVYVSDRGTNDVKIYSAVTTPDITEIDATTGQHSATVSARIGTAGAGNVTGCEVEYGTGTSYGSTVPCSGTLPFTSDHDMTADISGLATETVYHYRIRATNANGTTRSIDRTFTTHAVADVQAQPATNITRTSATINGSFTGNGEPTSYHFEWGTSTAYGNTTPESSQTSAPDTVSASADLDELDVYLEDSPPYHYRLVAKNAVGTTYGPDMTFHTLPPNLPAVSGETVANVTPTSAEVSAAVNPGLGATSYLIEYGPTSSYGQATVPSGPIGDDDLPHPVTTQLTELVPGVTYHYRVVATNFGGSTHGTDHTFNTPSTPTIGATLVSGVTETGATLGARIQPGFTPTTFHFEYGTDASYGSSTAESSSIGADNSAHAVSQAIGGLNPGTTYHFRAVASNVIGGTAGPDQSFTTPAAVVPPPPARRARKCKRGFVKRHGKCVRKKKKKHHRRRHHRPKHRHGGRAHG